MSLNLFLAFQPSSDNLTKIKIFNIFDLFCFHNLKRFALISLKQLSVNLALDYRENLKIENSR